MARKRTKLLYKGIRQKRFKSYEIMEVIFRDGNSEFFWRPTWSDVRKIFRTSVLTEYNNEAETRDEQLDLFYCITHSLYDLLEEEKGMQHDP